MTNDQFHTLTRLLGTVGSRLDRIEARQLTIEAAVIGAVDSVNGVGLGMADVRRAFTDFGKAVEKTVEVLREMDAEGEGWKD